MKYYCENCGAEWDTMKIDYSRCPFCKHEGLVVEFPARETVEQWEKRKGRKYPDTAPAYYFSGRTKSWRCAAHDDIFYDDNKHQIVATEAGAPPDDWRPE